jgi:hypothetical protein
MTGEFPVIPVPCHTHVTCHMLSLLFAVFLRKVANNFGVFRKSCIFASRTKNEDNEEISYRNVKKCTQRSPSCVNDSRKS